MSEAIGQLSALHPWLSTIRVGTEETPPEKLPALFGLLLSAFREASDTPLCFIVPRRGDLPRHAALLLALEHVRVQATAAMNPAQFKVGAQVRIHPTGHVFIFDGVNAHDPQRFWLRELNRQSRLDFPLTALARLATTTRSRPVGHLDQAGELRTPPTAPIDRLLGTATQGNLASFGTAGLLLDTRSGFSECAAQIFFSPAANESQVLKAIELPLGDAGYSFDERAAWLQQWKAGEGEAPPLIAVAHSPEQLAEFCKAEPARSRLVLVNGAAMVRNPQHFRDIADSQRLIIFADHDETETLDAMEKGGCEFWRLGLPELGTGAEGGLFENPARWARNHELLTTIEVEECAAPVLDESAQVLLEIQTAEKPDDEDPLARALALGWDLLNEAASWMAPPSAPVAVTYAARIADFRREIQRSAAYLAPAVRSRLTAVADDLSARAKPAEFAHAKGDALRRCLDEALHLSHTVGLVARHEAAAEAIRNALHRDVRRRAVSVFSIRALPDDGSFDVLIVASWPGGELLHRVAAKLLAPRIRLLGYAFERRWARQCERRLLARSSVREIPAERKTRIAFGKDSPVRWPETAPVPLAQPTPASPEFDIWRFETAQRRMRSGAAAHPSVAADAVLASYVRFVGDCFAFLTPGHALPVATNILTKQRGARQKLPERTVSEWRRGDFIVFPECGSRELVREVADKLLGDEAAHLRRTARIWKDALLRSRMSPPEFFAQTRMLGCRRCLPTIRNWLAESTQIGPAEEDDLRCIAQVTQDPALTAALPAIWAAIQEIWAAHLTAGMRLGEELRRELPEKLGALHEAATRVELGDLGAAWVVMVDDLAAEPERRGKNEVDWLRWPDDEQTGELL